MASPTADSTAAADLARRAEHVMGPGAASWSADQTVAWMGLLATHRHLTRGFSKAVEDTTGLSPTALGLLGRLHQADEAHIRISALADDIGLSLSRTSRVIDALEQRGFVARVQCPADARATNAVLTDEGRALILDAQATSNAWVREHFLEQLTPEETAALASVFERFAVEAATPCDAASHSAAACTEAAGGFGPAGSTC